MAVVFGAPRLQLALSIPLLIYGVLQAFPQLIFRQHLDIGSINVYSRSPVPPQKADRLREALRLIVASDIAVDNRNERIFLCHSNWLCRIFGRLSGNFFALSCL